MIPPPVPFDKVYTSCYCEENVYFLCRRFLEDESIREKWQPFAMFMSNGNKTVALWNQKNGRAEGMPVVWDYHVVLVLRPRNMQIGVDSYPEGGELQEVTAVPKGESWVYDLDSRLESPCPWHVYFNGTFPEDVVEDYSSQFRVVEGSMFVQTFASDRSHMLGKGQLGDAEYIAPPPPYPPIKSQEGDTNNLMECFVNMSMVEGGGGGGVEGEGIEGRYGIVLERDEVDELFI